SQVVEARKVSLATEDRFLRVELEVKNAGRGGEKADFSQGWVVGANERRWGIARDAQRVAGSVPLDAALAPGERRDFVMFFEVPESALAGGGLRLVVGRNGDGVISLD